MKQRLLNHWRRIGLIWDEKALTAFKAVKREDFVLKDYVKVAYDDRALPINAAQTISQPTTVMIMTQALEVKPGQKILEIGTGSGYQAAILSKIVGKSGKVYSLELIPELAEFAKSNLAKAKINNVEVICMDGSQGLPEKGPYDRIIVTAAMPKITKHLLNQLKYKAVMVAPVGSLFTQEMLKISKDGKKLKVKELGYFMFVPLKGKTGFK